MHQVSDEWSAGFGAVVLLAGNLQYENLRLHSETGLVLGQMPAKEKIG